MKTNMPHSPFIEEREKEFDENWPVLWYDNKNTIGSHLKSFLRTSLESYKALIIEKISQTGVHAREEILEIIKEL